MQKKVKNILLGVMCVLIVLVSGCSKTEKNEEKEPSYADKVFVEDMSAGLQERWKLNDADAAKEGFDDIYFNSKEYQDMMFGYIDAELNKIEKYTEEKFENKKLQELALKYINLLYQHKELCDYMTVDYDRYETEYSTIYDERSKVIKTMVDDYGMTVDEKYQDTLNDFITNSQLVTEQENTVAAVENMLKGIQFQVVEDMGDGLKTYQTIIENTTGLDFNTFNININLLDENGVIVESVWEQVNNFNNGAKAQVEFSTDKEFASTEVTGDWWE